MRAWGNPAAAYNARDRFNIANPASLGSLKLTNYQVGLYAKGMKVKSDVGSQNFGYATMDYLSLAFPIKHAAFSFGMLPLSRVNYNINDSVLASNGLPSYVHKLKGDGSVNDFYLAAGVSLTKNLRVGIKGSFIFGNLRNASRIEFSDSLNGFNSRYYDDRHLHGFSWLAGIQYDIRWKDDHKLTIGASGHSGNNIRATRDFMFTRYSIGINQTEITFDTVKALYNQKGIVHLPSQFDIGFMYDYKNKWIAAINYTYINTSTYRSFGMIDSFRTAHKISWGVQWIPNETALEGLYNRIKFRIGGYYQLTPLFINNTQIKRLAITTGLGLPVKRFFSDIDFSFEFGKLGTIKNNLLEENYVQGTLGFSISDRWFIKRRYD